MSGECPVQCPFMSGMLSEKMSDMSETVSGVSDSFWTGPRVDMSGAVRYAVRWVWLRSELSDRLSNVLGVGHCKITVGLSDHCGYLSCETCVLGMIVGMREFM